MDYALFGTAIFVFVLSGGCGGSDLKPGQADGGLGGTGGGQGSGGGGGAGGTSASGGTNEHVGGSGGGSGVAQADAGCEPGWTLCCGQCLGPSAGVCGPCPVGGTSGSGGGMGGADASVGADTGSTGGTMGGSGGTGASGTGGVAASGGTLARDAGPVDARPDSSAVEVQADAGLDASAVDVPVDVSAMTAFIDRMNGIWLVGSSAAANHFSWVRIRSASPGSGAGTADFLAGDDLVVNVPYWQCSGQGQWMIPEKPRSILFTFPASCPTGIQGEYTFDPFEPPGSYPNGVILAATVTPLLIGAVVRGYKFPDTQCNADMTSCSDPL